MQSFVSRRIKNLKIQTKLIALFVVIKVIPVIILSVIAVVGIGSLHGFFSKHALDLKENTKEVISSTANIAVEDSILALDRKSQDSLELMTGRVAQAVADFLYERDKDLLFLSEMPPSKSAYERFMRLKTKKSTQ